MIHSARLPVFDDLIAEIAATDGGTKVSCSTTIRPVLLSSRGAARAEAFLEQCDEGGSDDYES